MAKGSQFLSFLQTYTLGMETNIYKDYSKSHNLNFFKPDKVDLHDELYFLLRITCT